MAREVERLTALGVARLKKPGYYNDGAGLYLQVSPAGTKSWVFRFNFGLTSAGKRRTREMGLGSLQAFGLAEARDRAKKARQLLADRVDPIAHRDAMQSASLAASARAVTFEQAAKDYIASKEPGWKNVKHAQQWRNTLARYAYPIIGSMLVSDIEPEHVVKVLKQLVDPADEKSVFWNTRTVTATRVRERIELVIAAGDSTMRTERANPARLKNNLDMKLAKASSVAKVKHHEAVPIDGVGEFMVALRAQQGMGARALEFTILTAARSGEVRGATWKEVDFEAKTWTIPADRMKAEREHRVPLSNAALKVLLARKAEAKEPRKSDLIFPSSKGSPLSDMTLSAVMRRMNMTAVPHGFRSTFRDWAAERTNYPHEVAEMALAHAVGDKTEAAYRRGDLLQKRFKIMTDWADHCGRVQKDATVTPINNGRKKM